GHLVFTAWDPDHPATQSPTVIRDVIRGKIGFDGLLLTDDLDMQALSGTVPERAQIAVAAGCDIALNCWAKMDDMTGIASRLSSMSAQTAARLDRALAGTGIAPEGDKTELLATRDTLLAIAGANA
ncbi:MAG: glycoside hydrolase family 3 N-terminal domain-containing protein, partial [Tsuneonella sp.]